MFWLGSNPAQKVLGSDSKNTSRNRMLVDIVFDLYIQCVVDWPPGAWCSRKMHFGLKKKGGGDINTMGK